MNTLKESEISIITVTYNSKNVLKKFLKEVKKIKDGEIIIVDNNSFDGTKQILKMEKNIKKIFLKKNIGFSRANNIGFKFSKGKILLFLNPDSFPLKFEINKLKELVKKYKIVAPLILKDDKVPEDSVREFPCLKNFIFPFLWKKKIDYDKEQFVPQPMFSAIFIEREFFEKLKGFDEKFFIYFTDVEFMERAKKEKIYAFFYPEIVFYHKRGESSLKTKFILSRKYLDWGRGASKYFSIYRNFFEKIIAIPFIWIFTIIRTVLIMVL
jgi:GT2 family glycosyltransferase